MKSEIWNVSGEEGMREGEQGQRRLVWRHIHVYTVDPSLAVCFSVSSLLCFPSVVVSVVKWSYLLLSLFPFSDGFFILCSLMCSLCSWFRPHYYQRAGRGRHVAELRAAIVKAAQGEEERGARERVPHSTLWLVCGQLTCGNWPSNAICFSLSMFDFYHRGLLDSASNMTFSRELLYNVNWRGGVVFTAAPTRWMERIIYLYTCLVLHWVPPGDFNTAGRCCLLCAVTEVIQHLTKLKYHVPPSAHRLYEAQFDLSLEQKSKTFIFVWVCLPVLLLYPSGWYL